MLLWGIGLDKFDKNISFKLNRSATHLKKLVCDTTLKFGTLKKFDIEFKFGIFQYVGASLVPIFGVKSP